MSTAMATNVNLQPNNYWSKLKMKVFIHSAINKFPDAMKSCSTFPHLISSVTINVTLWK